MEDRAQALLRVYSHPRRDVSATGDDRSRSRASEPKGLDEYSDVLGMTPREHERRMRKWYVLLAIVGF